MDNGVASPELPEWLPDGWIMKTVSRKDGIVDLGAVALPTGISRHFIFGAFASYVSPVSRRTFRSRDEVLHYLNFESSDAIEAVKTICEEAKRSISPIWLPSGWILEIKTRKSGTKAGKKYKCYFDPFTGCRHYSKAEVFRHLNGEESCKFTTKKKKPPGVKPEEKHLCKFASDQKSISVDFRDDAIVENYPDGLPSSCIEEVKYRGNASKLGKDPDQKEVTRIIQMENSLIAAQGRESKRSREDDPDGELAQCSSRSGAKSGELALMMRRASKRLAGLEPDHVLSTEDIDRTLKRGRRSAQSRSSIVPTPFIDICDLEADSPEVNHGSLGKQFGSVEKAGAADTVAESAVTPPFNDYMLDQCIEFSIKKSLLPAQDANGRVKMLCKRTSTRNVPSFGPISMPTASCDLW
ncbi:unnamed protein product [Spirodela intermedia]|uniref:MBD domain-containing protein n=1 Tax=Spirodela intermedia TaxID=51605 RepID=A0A7I8IMI7_SPIIN|nr:unnamed protein product [Spirodela intermedia]CAA6658979.1 unnamed protein product [Spirodela intermedia]